MATDENAVKERVSFTERADDHKPDWDAEARKTGWRPQEEFQGAKEKWIDAEQWVKRGEQFIPFLQASKRELEARIAAQAAQLEESRRQNQAILKSLDELKGTVVEQTVTATATQKDELIEQIAKAHEDGDIRLELKLRDSLTEVNDALRAAKQPKPAVSTPPPQFVKTPELMRFEAENPWFESDPLMGAAAVAAIGQINADPEKVKWSPDRKYAEVARIVKQRFGMTDNQRRREPSRVEGGRMESTNSGGGRTYDDLPPEARTACDTLVKRFVGKQDAEGKVKYPDLASYRAKYTQDYYAEDWGTLATKQ